MCPADFFMFRPAYLPQIFLAGLIGSLAHFPEVAFAGDTPLPAHALVEDTLALDSTRSANAGLNGLIAPIGQVPWHATDDIVFGSEGGVTDNLAQAGMAAVPIHPDSGKIVRVQADVDPQGCGFTAVTLLDDDNLANFWKTAALWAYLGSGGNWGLFSLGQTHVLAKGVLAPEKFRADDSNRLELIYNPTTGKVSLRINGTAVVQDMPVIASPGSLVAAGIRINEPVTAGQPLIKNFAVDQPDAAP